MMHTKCCGTPSSARSTWCVAQPRRPRSAVRHRPRPRLAQLSLKADDPLAEDSRAPVEPDVLMAVMEAREALSSAVSAEQLEDIARANKAKQDSSLAGLRSAFEQEDLGEASKLLVRLQYYTKIAKEVEARGEALGVEVGGAA